MKQIVYTLTFILFIAGSPLQAQTLDSYLKLASENSPDLKASYTSFEAALKQVAQANALPDPKLSMGIFISPIETRVGAQRARFSLSQTFPWFGTLEAKGNWAKQQAEEKLQVFLGKKNELFLKVKQAYYPLYELDKQLALQRQNLHILQTYQALAQNRFANGKGKLSDPLRVELKIKEANTKIQLLEEQLRPLKVRLNRLMNLPDSSAIVIADTLLPKPSLLQQLSMDSLSQRNPKMTLLQQRIISLEAQKAVVEKKSKPQFGLGLDYAIISRRTDMDVANNGRNALMPMATVSIPISQKKYREETAEVQLMQEAIKQQMVATENKLFSDYSQQLYQLEASERRYKLYQEQQMLNQQLLELLYTEYGNSTAPIEELLKVQQQQLKHQIDQVAAITQYYLALSQLEFIAAKEITDY